MAKNSKTPVMVLQELATKLHWGPPAYNLVVAIDGTHSNKYEYEVVVPGASSLGFGTSKQIAKQDAAFKCLEALTELGIYNPNENPTQEFSGGIKKVSPESPFKTGGNFIVPLKDLCFENKLNEPIFTELSNAGPAHCKEFTYECRVSSIRTQATAGTKKQAKQLAAQEMMERIKTILPQLATETEVNKNEITNKEHVIKTYTEITQFENVVPDKSVYLMDYYKTIPNRAKERNLTYEDFKEELESRNLTGLEILLSKLELEYKTKLLQEKPTLMSLMLSTDTPFSIIGVGNSEEEALTKAINQTFDIIQCYLEHM